MASLYGNNDNDVPTVAAYAVSEADLRKTTDTSFLPTSTPTIGTYSQGPVHPDVETAPYYNNDCSSPPTGSTLYPLPPPPQSNSNTSKRWCSCLICGCVTLTISLVIVACCWFPIVLIAAAVSNNNSLRNSNPYPTNITQHIYHNYTNGTAGGYYMYNGTQTGV
jgi:hypothetical protein